MPTDPLHALPLRLAADAAIDEALAHERVLAEAETDPGAPPAYGIQPDGADWKMPTRPDRAHGPADADPEDAA